MGNESQEPLDGVAGIWDHQRVRTGTYKETTSFTFHGEAVNDGAMGAAEFGEALIGYSRMVGTAARTISPKAHGTNVRILTTRRGSFITELAVMVDLTTVEAVKQWFTGADATVLVQAAGILGGADVLGRAIVGAVRAGKWLRGRKVVKRRKVDSEHDEIETSDGDSLIELAKALDVLEEPAFRKGVREFSAPTTTSGIESVTLDGAGGGEEITSADRNWFADDTDDLDDVTTTRMLLKVVRVAFDDAAWRFEHTPIEGPVMEFSAVIADDDFLDDLAAHRIVFGDGDALDAIVETTSPKKPRRGARRHYRVLEVTRVVPREDLEPPGLLTEDGADVRDDLT